MKILMHADEANLLKSFLQETMNYFEYGIGGSTQFAAQFVKGSIFGVESDKEWVTKVQDETKYDQRINLRHIDIGPTKAWGAPTSTEYSAQFPAYSRGIVDTGRSDFDLCLVDGRFRVACVLQSLDHLPSGAVIAIHDYASRPHYHVIERYARPICSSKQLSFFVRRSDCNLDELKLDLERYRLNWE